MPQNTEGEKKEEKHIYMDHNATTYMLSKVSIAMGKMLDDITNAPLNPSSIHYYGRKAKNIIENARENIKYRLNASKEYQVIFAASGTEANNIALNQSKADVITSNIEHPSVLKVVGQGLINVDQNCEINIDSVIECLKELKKNQLKKNKATIVSIMLANNEIGTVQDIKKLVEMVKNYDKNIIFHTDATQAIGKIDVDINSLGVDMLTMSAHKFGGPVGAAALIVKKNVIDNGVLTPIMLGGGQEYRLRSGTQNVWAIYGMSVACDYINDMIIKNKKLENIIAYIKNEIRIISNEKNNVVLTPVVFFGENAKYKLPNTLSVSMPNVKAETQLIYFDTNGIAISAGSACSSGKIDVPHIHMAMGYGYDVGNTAIRISLGAGNTIEQAKQFIQLWRDLYIKSSY